MQLAQHVHIRLLQRGTLFDDDVTAVLQQFHHVRNMRTFVAFIGEEPLELVDTHARMLEAGDRLQSPDMLVVIDTTPRIVAADVGQQSLIFVVPQRGRLHVKLTRHLANRVRAHLPSSNPFPEIPSWQKVHHLPRFAFKFT